MTPAERQLIADLFDRLATVEDAQRDPDAERAIKDGLRQAPNAVYALVQTALVQQEALKQAEARIRQLEQSGAGGTPARPGSFLDGPFGRPDDRRGSVPNTRPAAAPMGAPGPFSGSQQPAPGPFSGSPQPMPAGPAPQPQGGSGSSFLGTAAAVAAGAIGGGLLMHAIRGMTGGGGGPGAGGPGGGFGFGNPAQAGERGGGLPWGGGGGPGGGGPGGPGGPGGGVPWGDSGGAGGGALSRDAGVDDIGRSGSGGSPFGQSASRDPFDSGGKRGGDSESYDRGEGTQGGEGSYDTANAADAYESEPAEDAGYEDDADYGGDDADVGSDDGGGDASSDE